MFKNFITLAYRHFVRSPLTSFIEVFGMTAALSVAILVLLWANHQLNFDQFNEHYERIYRVEESASRLPRRTGLPLAATELIKDNVPNVERVVSLRHISTERLFKPESDNLKTSFRVESLYADQEFIKTFTLNFIYGDANDALSEINTLVLTESLANKLFPEENPVGKYLLDESNHPHKITGVISDLPNFHLSFDLLRSLTTVLATYTHNRGTRGKGWNNPEQFGYLLLESSGDYKMVESSITALYEEHEDTDNIISYGNTIAHLRPLSEVYFHGDEVPEKGNNRHGNFNQIFTYSSLAIFSLLLACMNFINLNSAKCLERTMEIGVKKVNGASRSSLFLQFFGEVCLICLASLLLAFVVVHSLIPFFNEITNSTVSSSRLIDIDVLLLAILGIFIVSIVAGGLPAYYISSIKTVKAIKGNVQTNSNTLISRKTGLLIQFSITILLIIGIITVFRQLDFMKSIHPGINKDRLIYFDFNGELYPQKIDYLKKVITSHPDINSLTSSFLGTPGTIQKESNHGVTFEYNESRHKLWWSRVDADYLDVMGLNIAQGRFFEKNRAADNLRSNEFVAVINKTAQKLIGIPEPEGQKMTLVSGKKSVEIIGVVDDFHMNASNREILPRILLLSKNKRKCQLIVNISGRNLPATLRFIESEVEAITKNIPDIQFVDSNFEKQYGNEENFAELLLYITTLIIIIGSMGLLGIFAHAIKIRIKEIGVRKVLGASLPQIMKLLSGPIIKTILLSSIIAIPAGAVLMSNWLSNYPYRIEMDWTIYAVAIGSTLLIAALTIGWQCWQASNQNPARLIRYE